MAKPTKRTTDENIQNEDVPVLQTQQVVEETNFDSLAIGHIRLSSGKFCIIRVPVDSVKLIAGKIELAKPCEDLSDALYEFKMEAVRSRLV